MCKRLLDNLALRTPEDSVAGTPSPLRCPRGFALNNLFRIRLFGVFLLAMIIVCGPVVGQDHEYHEITTPSLRRAMESMHAHQIQYTMFMFYSLNVDTPGYVEIGSYNKRNKDTGAIKAFPYYRWRAGPFVQTDRELDFYLEAYSRGFFTIQLPTTIGYSRDGRFELDRDRKLVTVAGRYPVVGEGGGSIYLPEGRDIDVAKNGVIFVDGDRVDKFSIAIMTPESLNKLITINGAMFVAESELELLEGEDLYSIRQGHIEQSNVLKALIGDIGMAKRTYEGVAKSAKITARLMSSAMSLANPQ